MQLKTQLDEARQQLQSSKNAHLRNIEMMEVHSDISLSLNSFIRGFLIE